ncbi:uncharacterized protein LOC117307355 [Asterias rubens]|uniref:uncharacterized protein LOC117307355 n=1 Tax=Asterias rubens TaxID=7604 RepID=UPI001455D301|nr:uncharacterized protein LOC117307355 [Asterias rubens]
MAHIYERVVRLISKDPSRRHERDIESLIPWFQNMSGLFKTQKTDVVKDIVRNCEFRSVPSDNVIIKQGDKGDCFYIILSGTVSIYINQTLEEQGNIHNPNDLVKAKRKAKQRSRSNSRPRQIGLPLRERSKTTVRTETPNAVASQRRRKSFADHSDIVEVNGDDDSEQFLKANANGKFLKFPAGYRRSSLSQLPHPNPTKESRSHTWLSTYTARDASFFYSEDDQLESSSSEDEAQTTSTGKLDRTMFGVHIRELGPGKSFGELALVQTNLVRNASVIADQQTDLIVVNRDLYNRSLKAAQQQELAAKAHFVNNFQLFSHWTPRQRNVMTMSLTRVKYQYGNSIVKQGERVRGIIFIRSGRAVVSIDPIQHIEQYPNLCSKAAMSFAKEVRLGRRSRTACPGSSDYWLSELRKPGPHKARRRDGYAAAEKEVNRKSIQLCAIGSNDFIGDVSVFLHLPTYVSTVTCLEPVEALELDLNNFERQVFKKIHPTYVAMREIAELKLGCRVDRLRDEQVYSPVFESMLGKLVELNTPAAMKAALRRKQTEEEDLMASLFTPSWHSYREKQRLFLRRRQREKRLQEIRMQQMAHAASLGMKLRMQSLNIASELPDGSDTLQRRSFQDALPASLRRNSITSYSADPKARRLVRQPMASDKYDRFYLKSQMVSIQQRQPVISTGNLLSSSNGQADEKQ